MSTHVVRVGGRRPSRRRERLLVERRTAVERAHDHYGARGTGRDRADGAHLRRAAHVRPHALGTCVSASSSPDAAYSAAGRSRTTTVVLIVLTGWIGALYYWIAIKPRLADGPAPT